MTRPMLADLGLLFAMLAGGVLLLLAVGWSVMWWGESRAARRERTALRIFLAQLYELEVACGTEFPQVGMTVAYVRGLALGEPDEEGVVLFRARLRLTHAAAREPEDRR